MRSTAPVIVRFLHVLRLKTPHLWPGIRKLAAL